MGFRVTLLVGFSFLITAQFAEAAKQRVEIIDTRQEDFRPAPDSPEAGKLKGAAILVQNYLVQLEETAEGDYNYGTRLVATYETASVDNLEDYVFVQMYRGCKYESRRLPDGSISIEWNIVKPSFDDTITWHSPEWAVDSIDVDPVYNSTSRGRHYSYRWNTKPNSVSEKTEKLYGEERPTHARLYVPDHPGTAWFENGKARNISVEFKMCLFRAKDVPLESTASNTTFATPIHCFDWSSSFVYNHEAGKYESPKGLAPACQQPLPEDAPLFDALKLQ